MKRDGNEIEERIGSDEKELRVVARRVRSELFSGRAQLKDNSDPYNYR